jgi:hypothetical protein
MRRVRVFGSRHLHSPGDAWAHTPPENPPTVTLLRGSPPASLFARLAARTPVYGRCAL